jgi:sugar transferase (PEP-CTERM system associated)
MIRVFRVFMPASVVSLLVSELILIYFSYLLGVFLIPGADPEVFLIDDNGFGRIAVATVCIMAGIYLQDLYWRFRIHSRILLVQQVCLVVGVSFMVQAVLTYFRLADWTLSKWSMIVGSGLTLVLLPSWRVFYEALVLRALGKSRLLFLGSSPLNAEIAARVAERPELGLVSIGYLGEVGVGEDLFDIERLGAVNEIKRIAAEVKPDRIVVGMTERRLNLPVHDLLDLRFSGIHVEEAQTLYENAFHRVPTASLHPSQLIFSTQMGPQPSRVVLQDFYSFLLGFVGFTLTLPLMLITGLLVKLTSEGPILFRQIRVGKDSVPFTIYKFRSMYRDAEARTGAVWAVKDDPRITPLGRWIRKLRLDELPQLWNVVKGDMSITGPRPERPEFVQILNERIPYYRQRFCVKPGITGWAQINHKYGDTIEDTIIKLEYDLYYIKNLAFSLDAYIMFQTVKVMLLSRGAQ